MARNYEKNFGRLNRLWLEKETGKKEKRPKLGTLKTSEEISRWLPSIKSDLDFYLKQTEVPCYTDRKIDEYNKHIRILEIEYKAFVRKLHQLNSGLKTAPWTPRPYESKARDKPLLSLHPMSADVKLGQIEPFQTPVLMHDTHYQDGEPETKILNTEIDSQGINELPLFSNQIISSKQDPQRMDEQLQKEVMMNSDVFPSIEPHNYTEVSGRNPLGLDYSSSEDER